MLGISGDNKDEWKNYLVHLVKDLGSLLLTVAKMILNILPPVSYFNWNYYDGGFKKIKNNNIDNNNNCSDWLSVTRRFIPTKPKIEIQIKIALEITKRVDGPRIIRAK